MGSRIWWVFVAALCCIAASCGNSVPLAETTLTIEAGEGTSSELETDAAEEETIEAGEGTSSELETGAEDQELDDDDGTFDPTNWVDVPKWWSEVEEVYDRNPNLLFQSSSRRIVDTPPNDSLAEEMHLGDVGLGWYIPQEWEEVCSAGDCVYTLQGSEQGTRGFVAGWGGSKSRVVNGTGPDHNALVLEDPLSYVDGETQPLSCEPSNEKLGVEAVDLYPEPWFVACVGMVDGFSIARVEMFRLNKDCEPYGNSYGAWISWERGSATDIGINNFIEQLAYQMLADRIECVSLETLLSMQNNSYPGWFNYVMRLYFEGEDRHRVWQIWLSELQRQIGADVDGLYGPQTHELHFEAARNTDTDLNQVPLISSSPCGTFKFLIGNQQWEALEGLVVEWDKDREQWMESSAQLKPPGKGEGRLSLFGYYENKGSPAAVLAYPESPTIIETADVTGDGVNDFIFIWTQNQYRSAVATNHKRSESCEPWRYTEYRYDWYDNELKTDEWGMILPSLLIERHDVWLATALIYEDAQGNRCQSPGWNRGYVWYDEDTNQFVPTTCYYYSNPDE